MKRFKVGDRVLLVRNNKGYEFYHSANVGQVFKVAFIGHAFDYCVERKDGRLFSYNDDELEPAPKFQVGDVVFYGYSVVLPNDRSRSAYCEDELELVTTKEDAMKNDKKQIDEKFVAAVGGCQQKALRELVQAMGYEIVTPKPKVERVCVRPGDLVFSCEKTARIVGRPGPGGAFQLWFGLGEGYLTAAYPSSYTDINGNEVAGYAPDVK